MTDDWNTPKPVREMIGGPPVKGEFVKVTFADGEELAGKVGTGLHGQLAPRMKLRIHGAVGWLVLSQPGVLVARRK